MVHLDTQKVINQLHANWVWIPDWTDSSSKNTAGRIVNFSRTFNLDSVPTQAILRFSADTRYKLYVNNERVAVGPTRGSPLIWYYDSLDVAPFLKVGDNEIKFLVIRYFASSRGGMPFERTELPGLTVIGNIETPTDAIDISSAKGWQAQEIENIHFPTGLTDDVFLHINERIFPRALNHLVTPQPYNLKTLNGELPPWRLRQRPIPMPEESLVRIVDVPFLETTIPEVDWLKCLDERVPVQLPPNSSHVLELQAEVHSTAFLRWIFKATKSTSIKLKITYSEGYELEPRSYPFFRTKADRLDSIKGQIIGPHDEIHLDLPASQVIEYEPFWFRTFRVLRWEILVGPEPVVMNSFDATQTNYPLAIKASWKEPENTISQDIWDISVRTLRNCMFDGYSDCPFYEQLQYSCDSRTVGLFHFFLSGDDQLMRQSISNFASSITIEGLTQSRFPSHVKQIIAGFPLYWVLQVCDHHLFFGDSTYSRSFLPRIDGVLDFFDQHIDELGLVGNLPEDVWQYVDWVSSWGATEDHLDKGVPTSGRKTNRHTYFSLLYGYVLKDAAKLARDVGRPGHANEYETRANNVLEAAQKHCFDGKFFTDSTADVADESSYSQHCQVFAVLSGAAKLADRARLLTESFSNPNFSKCSYMMKFYALRAFALAGDAVYEAQWSETWKPWEQMLKNNLTTWEEDDVRQRSDCHAWGSVPLYEYCTELAGVQPIAPGCSGILFKPRLRLSDGIEATIALGNKNIARVSWEKLDNGKKEVRLQLQKPINVTSQLPGAEAVVHGRVDHLSFIFGD